MSFEKFLPVIVGAIGLLVVSFLISLFTAVLLSQGEPNKVFHAASFISRVLEIECVVYTVGLVVIEGYMCSVDRNRRERRRAVEWASFVCLPFFLWWVYQFMPLAVFLAALALFAFIAMNELIDTRRSIQVPRSEEMSTPPAR